MAAREQLLARQAEFIAEVRSHLTAGENERASDKLIWQRAIRFGPDTPEGHAKKLRNALAAATEYGEELEAALLATQPQPDPGEQS